MSISWKPVVVSALVAFIIAVVSAGISGVPFGALLIRALVGALIFGAGAVGIQLLIAKYLPELVSSEGGTEEPSGETAGGVDIVIDDDEIPGREGGGESIGDEESEELDSVHGETSESDDAEELDPLIEEVEEAEEAGVVASAPSPDESDEEIEAASVDTLPDVGEFADSFMADTTVDSTTNQSSGSTSDGQDPESIAKAIRTLMKRQES